MDLWPGLCYVFGVIVLPRLIAVAILPDFYIQRRRFYLVRRVRASPAA